MTRADLVLRARAFAQWQEQGETHRLLRAPSTLSWSDLATLPPWTVRLAEEAERIANDAGDVVRAHRAASRLDRETLLAIEEQRGEEGLDRLLAIDPPGALPEAGEDIIDAALFASPFQPAARALIGQLLETEDTQ